MLSLEQFLFHFGGKLFCEYDLYYKSVKEENIVNENTYKIAQEKTIAVLVGDNKNSSNYFVYDIDGKDIDNLDQLSMSLQKHLLEKEIESTIYDSGHKGYHVYVYIDNTLSLFTLKSVAQKLIEDFKLDEKFSDVKIEIFPKQTYTDYKNKKYGNHLKLPFTLNPKSGKHSKQITEYKLNQSNKILKKEDSILIKSGIPEVVAALSTIFSEGKRHQITLAVTGFLKNSDVEKSTTIEIFDSLLALSGGDKLDIRAAIDSTYERHIVAGLSFANDITDDIKNILYNFVSSTNPTYIIREQIIAVRLSKTPKFLQVEKCSNIIYDYIKSKFRVFNDGNFFYLLDKNIVITDRDITFKNFISSIGLNQADNYTNLIISDLIFKLMTKSQFVEIKPFSKYTGNILVYNSNNTAIHISKEEIKEVEVDFPILQNTIFSYSRDGSKQEIFTKVLKTFGLSRDDIEITISWLVTQFYLQKINTKPILLITGPPSSGKTTLANFLLQIVEKLGAKSVALGRGRDSLISSITNHKMLVLDNLEYLDSSTTDLINSIVTGTNIEMRKLYTTNEMISYPVECSLCITSAYESFNADGALVTRTINISIPPRDRYIIESKFIKYIENNYNAIMSEICDIVQKSLINLEEEENTYQLRISDFIAISKSLHKAGIVRQNIEEIILKRQLQLRIDSPMFKIFLHAMSKKPNSWKEEFTINDIIVQLSSSAKRFGINNINLSNAEKKLLSTGLFMKTEKGLIVSFTD